MNGYLYYNQGKTINKMDAVSGERVASGAMVNNSSFSIVPPTYADGKIFVGIAGGIVQAFDAKTLKSLWVYTDKLGDSRTVRSPIMTAAFIPDFGILKHVMQTLSASALRMKIRKRPTKPKRRSETYTSKGGFYWAGADVCENFLLVGTDDGDSA